MDIWNYILLILIALFVGFTSIFLFMGCKIGFVAQIFHNYMILKVLIIF